MEQEKLDSALMDAVLRNNSDAMLTLLEQGANPNTQDSEILLRESVLHKAVRTPGMTLVRDLLRAGSNPNLASDSGSTPLHIAANCGKAEHVETLLRHGANVGAVDVCGDTPLHMVSSRRGVRAVEMLLRAGASLEAVNENGLNPSAQQGVHTDAARHRLEAVVHELSSAIVPASMPSILPDKRAMLQPQPLEQGEFNVQNIGFWQQFEALGARLEGAGKRFTADEIRQSARAGKPHFLDYASQFFAERKALSVLGRHGVQLSAEDLVNAEGTARPFVQAMERAGTLNQLFTREVWGGKDVQAMRDCYRALCGALGEEAVNYQVRNLHQLATFMDRQHQQLARGR